MRDSLLTNLTRADIQLATLNTPSTTDSMLLDTTPVTGPSKRSYAQVVKETPSMVLGNATASRTGQTFPLYHRATGLTR